MIQENSIIIPANDRLFGPTSSNAEEIGKVVINMSIMISQHQVKIHPKNMVLIY